MTKCAAKKRITNFQQNICDIGIGYALLQNTDGQNLNPNFFYLTNYTGIGSLLIPAEGEPRLLVPDMEYLRAKKTSFVTPTISRDKLTKELPRHLPKNALLAKKTGIDYSNTSIERYNLIRKNIKAKLLDVSDICRELRVQKTPDETEKIQEACNITDKIFKKLFTNIRSFKTESDINTFLLYETARSGCEMAFKPIVASGPNAAEPHHDVGPIRINKGFCIIDYGVRYKGYCADMTRTIHIGNASKEAKETYKTVLAAHDYASEKAVFGANFAAVEKAAREKLGKHAAYMNHSIGHGLGIEIHEYPTARESKNKIFNTLSIGSVFTIEPGIYYPKKFGIRIEDDYLMTKKGPKALTKTTPELTYF
jgi:Xaa-Pro aminopeptidase